MFFVILAPPFLPAPSPFFWKSPKHLHSKIYYLRGPKKFRVCSFQQGGGAENTVIPHALTMCQVLRVCDSVRFSQFYNSHSFLLMEMGRKKREVKLLAQGHTASKREVGFELPTWFALPPCSPIPAELLWLEGHGQIDPLALWSQGSQ